MRSRTGASGLPELIGRVARPFSCLTVVFPPDDDKMARFSYAALPPILSESDWVLDLSYVTSPD